MTRLSCIDIDFSLSFSLFQFFFHFDCCCPYLFDFIQTHFNSAIQKIIYESLHNIFSIHYLSLCLAELWSFAIWSHFEMIDLFLNEWASECVRAYTMNAISMNKIYYKMENVEQQQPRPQRIFGSHTWSNNELSSLLPANSIGRFWIQWLMK